MSTGQGTIRRHPVITAAAGIYSIVSFLFLVLALPTVSDQVEGWGPWISWISHGAWRWALPVFLAVTNAAFLLILIGLVLDQRDSAEARLRRDFDDLYADGREELGNVRDMTRPLDLAAFNDWTSRAQALTREHLGRAFELRLGDAAGLSHADLQARMRIEPADRPRSRAEEIALIYLARIDEYRVNL